jgi:hypothetical protein
MPVGNGNSSETFYSAYREYCLESGLKPVSLTVASPRALQLCQEIGWDDVTKYRTTVGVSLRGLRLRVHGADNHIPCHEQFLQENAAISPDVEKFGSGSTYPTQPLQDKDLGSTLGSTLNPTYVDPIPDPPISEPEESQHPDVDPDPTHVDPDVDSDVDLKPSQGKGYVDYVDLRVSTRVKHTNDYAVYAQWVGRITEVISSALVMVEWTDANGEVKALGRCWTEDLVQV